MSVSTSVKRVLNHNNWPSIDLFDCERSLLAEMAKHNIQQIFSTAKLEADDTDEDFNALVGYILDGLDSLPRRPDAAFDCLYRAIDRNLYYFTKPGSSQMHTLVDELFNKNPNEWAAITNILTECMPQQTADYAANRVLDCHIESNPPHTDAMKTRAKRSLGSDRYKEFCEKYLVKNPQISGEYFNLEMHQKRNAGRLMLNFFRLTAPLILKQGATPKASGLLDLTNSANLLSPNEKLRSLLEILIATYRHERFHGQTFTPFRSSKASLKTYAHAYYVLMVTYIFILGILHHLGKGGLDISSIIDSAKKNMDNLKSFFGDVLDK